MITKLYIHYPDEVHGYGLCFQSDDTELNNLFKQLCYKHFINDVTVNRLLGPFFQSGHLPISNWFYFEMLKMCKQPTTIQEDVFIHTCEVVSVGLNVPLD